MKNDFGKIVQLPTHKQIEEEQMIERYLAEKLSPKEAEDFEQHYLQCDRCFSELETRHLAIVELRKQASTSLSDVRDPDLPTRSIMNPWRWGLVAAAVSLLLILPVYWLVYREQVPPESIAMQPADVELLRQLARVEKVSPYLAAAIRGGEVNAAALEKFREGMEHYQEEEYQRAIPVLREVTELDVTHIPSAFYLGICHLMANQFQEAIEQLERVIASGSDGYQEEAHWYLAKAYFGSGQMDKGQTALERVVAFKGGYLEDAQKNLELLKTLKEEQ